MIRLLPWLQGMRSREYGNTTVAVLHGASWPRLVLPSACVSLGGYAAFWNVSITSRRSRLPSAVASDCLDGGGK